MESELAAPHSLDLIVAEVASEEEAEQVCGASLLAVTVDLPAEGAYLKRLQAALKLSSTVVAARHERLGITAF